MASSFVPDVHTDGLFALFFTMHMFGWIFSLVMLLTVLFSPRVHRNLTWTNLCFCWVIACLSYSFLLITGQAGKTNPNHGVCMVQAGLVYGVPSLSAGATLSFVIMTWLNVKPQASGQRGSALGSLVPANVPYESIRNILLVALPYLVPIGLIVGVYILGYEDPSHIRLAPHGLYCSVENVVPGRVSAIYVAATILPIVTFESLIIYSLYRNHRIYAIWSANGMSTVVRLVIFTIVGIFSVGISLSYFSSGGLGRLPNVFEAMPPVFFVLVFGTQWDLFYGLMFWRVPPGRKTTGTLTSSTRSQPALSTLRPTESYQTKSVGSIAESRTSMDDVEKYAGMKPKEVPVPF